LSVVLPTFYFDIGFCSKSYYYFRFGSALDQTICDNAADTRCLNDNLLTELNECFLFHGTNHDVKEAIIKKGFDARLGNQNALFGPGNYFAESSTKADQYAGNGIE